MLPDKGMQAVRPWWDTISGHLAEAMSVVSLVAISLKIFVGFTSFVRCVPTNENFPIGATSKPEVICDDIQCVTSGGAIKEFDSLPQLSYSQRLFVDAFCTEKLGVYAQDLGYLLFAQTCLLMIIDNFWLKWSRTASKMKSFVGLAKSCLKNPCTKKLVKTQLARTRGERPELKDPMKLGLLTRLTEAEIREAVVLSDKAIHTADKEAASSLLARVYVTKTVGKAVTALAFLAMGTKHLVDRDFDFSYNCDATHLRRVRYKGDDYDKIVKFDHYLCSNKLGPVYGYLMMLFNALIVMYILSSVAAVAKFFAIRKPIHKILHDYDQTIEEEDLEKKLKSEGTTDVLFLLFFLYTKDRKCFENFKDFLSPFFHDDLIRLASHKEWDAATIDRRKIDIGNGFYEISLADLDLIELPQCLFKVQGLKELDLSFNEDLDSLTGIKALVELTSLNIDGCAISDLAEVMELTNLTRLSVSDNPLKEIPDNIDQKLPYLKVLDIHECDSLKELPTVLNAMTHLEDLRVDRKLMKKLDPTQSCWQEESLEYMYRRKNASLNREITA